MAIFRLRRRPAPCLRPAILPTGKRLLANHDLLHICPSRRRRLRVFSLSVFYARRSRRCCSQRNPVQSRQALNNFCRKTLSVRASVLHRSSPQLVIVLPPLPLFSHMFVCVLDMLWSCLCGPFLHLFYPAVDALLCYGLLRRVDLFSSSWRMMSIHLSNSVPSEGPSCHF